jgi:hypothetical protein
MGEEDKEHRRASRRVDWTDAYILVVPNLHGESMFEPQLPFSVVKEWDKDPEEVIHFRV